MKTYTTDEVIALYDEYYLYDEEMNHYGNTFEQWLKEKEQLSLESEMFANFSRKNISEKLTSELPVKDQLIWVKWNDDYEYIPRHFHSFGEVDGVKQIYCFADGKNSITTRKTTGWDQYSLTNPNE